MSSVLSSAAEGKLGSFLLFLQPNIICLGKNVTLFFFFYTFHVQKREEAGAREAAVEMSGRFTLDVPLALCLLHTFARVHTHTHLYTLTVRRDHSWQQQRDKKGLHFNKQLWLDRFCCCQSFSVVDSWSTSFPWERKLRQSKSLLLSSGNHHKIYLPLGYRCYDKRKHVLPVQRKRKQGYVNYYVLVCNIGNTRFLSDACFLLYL